MLEQDEAPGSNNDYFLLLPENKKIVEAFLSVSTQWRTSFSGITGLDYNAIEATQRMLNKKFSVKVFKGIQIMEAAVLKELANKN